MKNIYNITKIAFATCLVLMISVLGVRAQSNGSQTEKVKVSAVVVDDQGQPVSGAAVFNAAGAFAVTAEDGSFDVEIDPDSKLLIEKDGMTSLALSFEEITDQITMIKTGLLLSDKDEVNLGYTSKKKRNIVGAVSTITPGEFMKYDNTQWASDAINGKLLGVRGSSDIRGMGDALVVVDGIPGRYLDVLNMEEIEQITVLKDANAAALYGAMARNGVIVVTTKRGKAHHKDVNVNLSYGLADPISYPKYLKSAEYMVLYNEARANDGQTPSFTNQQIQNYLSGDKVRYPDVDLYSSDYLKPTISLANAMADFVGGNDNTQYYVNLGYKRESSLVKINPDVNGGGHQFNVRGNIDFKINDWIKSSLDVVSIIYQNKSSLTSLLSAGTIRKPHWFSPILPLSAFDTTGNPTLSGQLKAANVYNGGLLGTANTFEDNTPIAETYAGGYAKTNWMISQFNNAIDFDLSRITEGLSAKTYLSFDFYNQSYTTVINQYAVYEPQWDADRDVIIGLTKYGKDLKDQSENINNELFITRYGFYGMLNYDKELSPGHKLNASLLGFANSTNIKDSTQMEKYAHVGFQLGYTFKDKIQVDFSGSYLNSTKLPEGNRGGLSPTVGLAYILSEESFMDNVSWIDYLKIRGSVGRIYSDIGISKYFSYEQTYNYGGGQASYTWGDAFPNNETTVRSNENKDFYFEKRVDMNLGLEAYLLGKLWVEWNIFRSDIKDRETRRVSQYPSFYSPFIPYTNYDADRYSGTELGVNYKEQFGELGVSVGARMLYAKSERIQVDELPYVYDYQYKEGTPVYGIWGLEDNGFYGVSDFDTNGQLREGLPIPSFGVVRPGDIKYIDQNNDGVINEQDEKNIGEWMSPISYGFDMQFEYKNFTLFMLFSGMAGGDGMKSGNYYWVDGDDKYSEVVMDRWTPETANTATYPRLSSTPSANNFRSSTFWLYDNSYFNLQRAQLTYLVPTNISQKVRMKNLRVYLSGNNLFELGPNTKIRQLRTGGSPEFRLYSIGLRATF